MADLIKASIVFPGIGKGPRPYDEPTCKDCRKATSRNLFRHTLVEICDPHLEYLRQFGKDHPERLIVYDNASGSFYWSETVLENPEDVNTPGGDKDPGQRDFDRALRHRPTADNPFPFSTGELIKLLKLRSAETRAMRNMVVRPGAK